MKNISKIMIFLLIILTINVKNVYAISKDFEFLINTVGVPKYNTLGKMISEDIYNKYNVFSYDEPTNITNNSKQRFKETTQGKYNFQGKKGEFNILGYNYNGGLIYNFYFPVDFVPETTPNNWNYIVTSGALESWERSKFLSDKSLEYMKTTSMLFDEIDYENNKTNPYNQTDYNLTANKIGLNKVTMNTYATFKTKGILTARRNNPNGYITYSIFSTKPMAVNSGIRSKIISKDNVVLSKNEDIVKVKLDFGSNIYGLNEYATKDLIKEIVSELYIDNKKVSEIKSSKTDNVNRVYEFEISRDNYNKASKYPICIKVESYFYTEFDVDGVFKDQIEKTIYLEVEEKEIETVRSNELNILEKNKNNEYILTNLITKDDIKTVSSGIIEKGRYLTMSIKTTKLINTENLKLQLNNSKCDYEVLVNKDNITILKIYINPLMENTIKSWNYLRENNQNYFDIDIKSIGERISKPNELKLVIDDKEYIKYFDTIDYFEYNTNFSNNKFIKPKGYTLLHEK